MTLPDERYRAMTRAAEFLEALCDPKKIPRIPLSVRNEARSVLRHYPSQWDLDQMAEHAPNVIRKEIEPLTRMVMKYDQEKS